MDIGIHVRGEIDKEEKERLKRTGNELVMTIARVEADLLEATTLTDCLKELEDDRNWYNFQRILIKPAIEKVKKEISEMNKRLAKEPEIVTQLVYNNAFLEVLTVMSDFEGIRKNNVEKQKSLQSRLKELQKELSK